MTRDDAAARVRQRIYEWVKREGRGSQRRLAQSVPAKFGQPRTDAWVSDILRKRQSVSLHDLDAIADAMGVPPGDLVRRNDRNYMELTMVETRLVGYFRTLPEIVRNSWMTWLDYIFQRQLQAHDKPINRQRRAPMTSSLASDR